MDKNKLLGSRYLCIRGSNVLIQLCARRLSSSGHPHVVFFLLITSWRGFTVTLTLQPQASHILKTRSALVYSYTRHLLPIHKHAVLCDAGDHSVTTQNHPREHRTNFHDEKTFRAAKCTGKVSQGNAERPRSPRATYSDRAFDRDVTGRRQSPPTPYTAPDWRRLQKQETGPTSRGRTGGVANFPLG